jgi:GTP 3',8-cyclase
MLDGFKRRINYLRISVTDRCNLRCTYCMPAGGIQLIPHDQILSYEEILDVVKAGVAMGINKVRITGGEPLVRKGIVGFTRMLSQIQGIEDLAMTTNGILLESFAISLKQAGLKRINVSLDSMDPERFGTITRGGKLEEVIRGIKAAKEAGLDPIKINCVIRNSSDEPDAAEVRRFCMENGYQVRFIHQMDLGSGHFKAVEGGDGGNCSACNRLRLTADGRIKPCLFNDLSFSVRELGAEEALRRATGLKPEKGTSASAGKFYNIGG